MPSFTFRGFTTGSPVAIAAAQGATSDSASVPTWGQGATASLTIAQTNSVELVAPVGIGFEATNPSGFTPTGPAPGEVYDPRFHEITYIWNFNDDANAAPTTSLNLPDAWKDINKAYGQRTAHVFNRPGTYTVSVLAYDRSGNFGYDEFVVQVQDPAKVYTGTRTILYDPTGTGDSVTYPGANVQTTLSGAFAAAAALTSTGRLLIKRGEDITGFDYLFGSAFNHNIRIGAWGTGNRPIFRPDPQISTTTFKVNGQVTTDVIFSDIDFRCRWDPTTETGHPNCSPLDVLSANDASIVVHRCRVSGASNIYVESFNALADLNVIFNDTEITDWHGYGILSGLANTAGSIAVIGSSFHQNADACLGSTAYGASGDPISSAEGPFRNGGAPYVYISASEFYSNTGTTSDSNGNPAVQACVRLNTGANVGVKVMMDRVAMEGGWDILKVSPEGGLNTVATNICIDKVLMVAASDTFFPISIYHGGVVLKNTLVYLPDVTHYLNPQGTWIDAHNVSAGASTSPALSTKVGLYNTTLLNMSSSSNVSGIEWGVTSKFSDTVFENYIHYAPNAPSPVTTYAPIDVVTTIPGFTPRNAGIRFSLQKPSTSGTTVSGSGGTVTFSYPSGTAQGDTWGSNAIVIVNNGAVYCEADYGSGSQIAVSYGASNITVTNNSGVTWNSGATLRASFPNLDNATDATYATSGGVPLARPTTGSSAIGVATTGFIAHDDILGTVRGNPADRGAFEAA